MLASIPVVQEACWDDKGVVLVTACAVVPATIAANLGFASGQANFTLAPYKVERLVKSDNMPFNTQGFNRLTLTPNLPNPNLT